MQGLLHSLRFAGICIRQTGQGKARVVVLPVSLAGLSVSAVPYQPTYLLRPEFYQVCFISVGIL